MNIIPIQHYSLIIMNAQMIAMWVYRTLDLQSILLDGYGAVAEFECPSIIIALIFKCKCYCIPCVRPS